MKSTYKFTLEKDHYFYVEALNNVYFKHKFFECVYGNCVIKKGYSWDGCSFVKDYSETYFASCEHDCLYQFGYLMKVRRKYVDLQFYKTMVAYKFEKAKKYYLGVRTFGWIFYYTNNINNEK